MRSAMRIVLLSLVAGTIGAPAPAFARTYVNPWAGVIFGNNEATTGFKSFGIALGDESGGFIGTESSIGLSPGFFGDGVQNYVLDMMGGVTLGPTIGRRRGRVMRPYAVIEVGIIRESIESDIPGMKFARNDIGYCLGGGLNYDISDRVALRGDIRYFRTFDNEDALNGLNVHLRHFHYMRAAIGLTLQ